MMGTLVVNALCPPTSPERWGDLAVELMGIFILTQFSEWGMGNHFASELIGGICFLLWLFIL